MIFERIQIHSNVFCCKDNAQKVVSLHRFLRKLAHFAVLHLFANKRNKKKLNIQTNGISK